MPGLERTTSEVSVGTGDKELWKQVDELFKRRPGWTFQAMATPGAPPFWSLGPEGEPELRVTVDGGSITVSVTATDFDVALGSVDELVAWLNDYRPGALAERKVKARDKFKRRHLFDWE